jgi:hypothetical protein
VDCPACGRSLRVPLKNGAPTEAISHKVVTSDSRLIQALEVLAAPVENPSEAGGRMDSTISRPPDSQTFSEQTLQEIAGIAPPTHAALPGLRASKPNRNFRTLMFSFLVVASAFAAGYFFPHTESAGNPPKSPRNPAVQGIDIPHSAPHPQPAEKRLSEKVLSQNTSGDVIPDEGALIILTPRQNPTSLKLDARPLNESPDNAAHKAIKAALAELQVMVTTSTADGTCSFPVSESNFADLQLIAVSRHNPRLPNAATPDTVKKAIEEWFESAPHLTGRLAASVTAIPLRNGLPVSAPAIIFRTE